MTRSIGRLALLATATAGLLVTAAPPAAATPSDAVPTAGAAAAAPVVLSPEAELSSAIATLTNAHRTVAGCGPLTVDPLLVEASVQQSTYMAATGTFGHIGWGRSTFLTRARAAGYAYPAGENIAWGFPAATDVMNAWMASPGHRANILNCGARSFGIGVRFGANGVPYYTQVFGWR